MDRIKKKHLLEWLDIVVGSAVCLAFIVGIGYALGYADVWPFRNLYPDRINGLCGVQLDQPWDGKAFTSFRTFSKPVAETMKDTGDVWRISISSQNEDYDQILGMLKERFSIEPTDISKISKEEEYLTKRHRLIDTRSGNYILISKYKKIPSGPLSTYDEYRVQTGQLRVTEIEITAYSVKGTDRLSKQHQAIRNSELKKL